MGKRRPVIQVETGSTAGTSCASRYSRDFAR